METATQEKKEDVKQHLNDAYVQLKYAMGDIALAFYDLIALEKYVAVRTLNSVIPDITSIIELVKDVADKFEKEGG